MLRKYQIHVKLNNLFLTCSFFRIKTFDSIINRCTIILIEPTMPLIFTHKPVGLFIYEVIFMYNYPKQILTITQQIQSYIDSGLTITSTYDVEKALTSIGFYRLRGYSFHL